MVFGSLLEAIRHLELRYEGLVRHAAVHFASKMLARLRHAFVVLLPVLVAGASGQLGVGGALLMAWPCLMHHVLIRSIKVGVRAAELQELVAAQHLLHLLMIDLIQPSKFVFLEPKGRGPFEVRQPVVLKRILLRIVGVLLKGLILICLQLISRFLLPVVALSVQDRLDLSHYPAVVIFVAIAFGIYAIELPVSMLHDLLKVSLGRWPAFAELLRDRELPLDVEESLELGQLPLEAHVWEDDRALFAGVRKGVLEAHVTFLHEVSDHAGGGAGDAGVAMDEDGASTRHAVFDESYGRRKVAEKALV